MHLDFKKGTLLTPGHARQPYDIKRAFIEISYAKPLWKY